MRRMHASSIVTLMSGLAFIAGGILAYHHLGNSLAQTRQASAVVVEIVYETGTMQKGRKHPVVRYKTEDGREIIGRSETHHKAAPGDVVQIVYDPRNPERVDVGTLVQASRQRVFLSGAAVILGLVMSLGITGVERGWWQRFRG